MARRTPVFAVNDTGAAHINIAHGLYPCDSMSATDTSALAQYLTGSVRRSDGRSYAGGLTKFEPSDMCRLLVPGDRAHWFV